MWHQENRLKTVSSDVPRCTSPPRLQVWKFVKFVEHIQPGGNRDFFFSFASQPSGDVNSPQASWPVGRVIVRLWCLNVCQWCKPTEPDEAAEKNPKKPTRFLKHHELKLWIFLMDATVKTQQLLRNNRYKYIHFKKRKYFTQRSTRCSATPVIIVR